MLLFQSIQRTFSQACNIKDLGGYIVASVFKYITGKTMHRVEERDLIVWRVGRGLARAIYLW